MSAASSRDLTTAELAVLRQLARGDRFQAVDAIAAGARMTHAAVVLAVRYLHYARGFVTPDDATVPLTSAAWACTTLGEAAIAAAAPALVA